MKNFPTVVDEDLFSRSATWKPLEVAILFLSRGYPSERRAFFLFSVHSVNSARDLMMERQEMAFQIDLLSFYAQLATDFKAVSKDGVL